MKGSARVQFESWKDAGADGIWIMTHQDILLLICLTLIFIPVFRSLRERFAETERLLAEIERHNRRTK